MEITLSKRVQKLKASATLSLAAKAKELKAEGKDVISLSVGEPNWNSFQVAVDAGLAAIKDGETKYMPSNGMPALRQAIVDQVNSDLNTDYKASEVSVTAGGKFTLHSLMNAILSPGDEVIVPAPYWVSYPTLVEMSEGNPKIVACGADVNYKLSAELLKENLNDQTKALILNSPSNPTGEMYSKEELQALIKVIKDYPNLIIISDDIYNRLVFDGETLAPHILQLAPELKNRTLIVNGVSKTYSMTGWRLGWTIGPENVIGAMNKFQSQTVSCASSMAQHAALAAIKNGEPELKTISKELEERRDLVHASLNKIPGVKVESPKGAFYFWPNVSEHFGKSWNGQKIETSACFSKFLLESKSVVAVPGNAFGLDGYLRVSFALSKERMQEAADRITEFVGELS